MMLTKVKCDAAKPKNKPYKLNDGQGLYLHIMPNGSRYWRMRCRFLGKEKTLSFGVFPEVSITEARDRVIDARKQMRKGEDPGEMKKKLRYEQELKILNTFEKLALAWYEHNKPKWSLGHAQNVWHRLEKEVLPLIGDSPVDDLSPRLLHKHIQAIQDRGANEMARRVRQYVSQIFSYGIATERAERNPAAEIRSLMRPYKRGHYRALEYKDLPKFLLALENNEARLMRQTRLALKFMLLTFVRTNELVLARWSEFDLTEGRWTSVPRRLDSFGPQTARQTASSQGTQSGDAVARS